MRRLAKRLTANRHIDETLDPSEFDVCRREFSATGMHRAIEEDAKAAWKMLVHSGRESLDLAKFTVFVNGQFERNYRPEELGSIFDALKSEQIQP